MQKAALFHASLEWHAPVALDKVTTKSSAGGDALWYRSLNANLLGAH